MFNRWAALAFVLALCVSARSSAGAQQSGSTKSKQGGIGQNSPNPFNPETTIPFIIGDSSCTDATTQHVVSLQIYNVLSQVVATPRLQTPLSGGAGSSAAVGQYMSKLKLTCGRYSAYWDGKYQGTTRSVASGFYIARLTIDGKPFDLRMTVTK